MNQQERDAEHGTQETVGTGGAPRFGSRNAPSQKQATTPEDIKLAEDAETLARLLVRQGVWDALLDRFGPGRFPVTRTGNYSDVTVVTPEGETPWAEVSRFSAQEMLSLSRDVAGSLAPLLFAVLLHEREGRMEELLDGARRQEAGLLGEGGV